ncbi:hypothetical protein MD484_g4200, partial [Candolleomyces efflorescens]
MPSSSSSSVMDTSGFAQVGKFGTLSLLKNVSAKRLNLPAQASGTTGSDVVVTSFGIDTEELTFGRDPSCSVRLYYPDVAVVHCKIMFEERKAFLAVIGESGLIVDGCEVYPNRREGASPTMIPLQNESEIEIRGKRFRFSYPPKEMRAVLFSTPTPKSNRKLRLSMIQSAEVFSPRPSNDPSENLRILQSPLKNQFKSPTKRSGLSQPPVNAYRQNSPTPQRHQQPDHDEDDDEEEDEIILVDGNQPRVVQEDRDLVILEDVEVAPPMPLVRVQQYQNLPPRTPPRRKSMGRNTLHRAVLIRSAQRAVIRAEEEEEEREVLETVVSELVDSDEDDEEYESVGGYSQEDEYAHPPEQTQLSDEDVDMQDASDDESEREDGSHQESGNGANNKPLWRKSLERIWPFKGSEGNDQDEDEDNQDEEEGDQAAPLPAIQTPARRTLGSFLTPQFKYPQQRGPGSNNLFNRNSPAPASGAGRFSLGGGEPRRVLVEQPWRVKDLVVPVPSEHGEPPASPGMGVPVPPSPRRAQLSEEERKAIQERRRSALREPDNFFPGGVPGMSPTKQAPSTPFTSPMKPSIPFASLGAGPSSPPKARRTSGDEEDLDTRSLLEKMKETVEGMKKRRSLAPATPVRELGAGIGLGLPSMGSVKKLNLPPAASVPSDEGMMDVEEELEQAAPVRVEEDEQEEDKQPEQRSNDTQGTFSLLRPEARKSFAFPEAPQLVETPPTPAKAIPDAATAADSAPESEEHSGMELDSPSESEVVEAPKNRGRSKLLRPTATTKPASKGKSTLSVAEAKERSRSTSREPRRSARSKTPQPDEEQSEEPEVPAPKAPASRRPKADVVPGGSKRATATKKTPEVVESDDSEPPLPPPRRGRKAVASASSNGESSQTESGPVKRGGSKAAVKKEPTEESVRKAAATKRTVRKTPAAASASEQSDSVSEIPVPKRRTAAAKSAATTTAAAKKRATSKSRTAVASQDVEDSVEEVEEVPAPTKKASAAAKGKKKADVVKEEDDDEPPLPQPKPVRGRAAATTSKATAASSLKTPAVRATRSAKKTPSTAPAVMEGVDNKENEKAGGSGSGTNEEGVAKVKVSRSRAKAAPASAAGSSKTVVKDEPVEEAPKARVMRSRARTKTG